VVAANRARGQVIGAREEKLDADVAVGNTVYGAAREEELNIVVVVIVVML
jgi:hypothetical protein